MDLVYEYVLTRKIPLEHPQNLIADGGLAVVEPDRLHLPVREDACQVDGHIFTGQRQLVEVLEHRPDIFVRLAGFDHVLTDILRLF